VKAVKIKKAWSQVSHPSQPTLSGFMRHNRTTLPRTRRCTVRLFTPHKLTHAANGHHRTNGASDQTALLY